MTLFASIPHLAIYCINTAKHYDFEHLISVVLQPVV